MRREGAELALSYQTDKLRGRVDEMAAELGSDFTMPLDVADDAQIDGFFAGLTKRWDGFDILVHSVAFAPRDQLDGRYIDAVNREGFRIAHDVSSYSLAALARKSEPLMRGRAGALLTLSYLGAVRTLPNYNVMGLAKASLEANVRFLAMDLGASGIRINAISAGPITHARRVGCERHPADDRAGRCDVASEAQRHDRRRRQCRCVPVLRPRGRHHGPSHLRRLGIQHRRHGLPRRHRRRTERLS